MIKQTDTARGRPFAGIHCPKCGSIESHVTDSRNNETSNSRRRRYECNRCRHRYTTYEVSGEDYERLQTVKLDISQIDSVIAVLRMIKVQFNGGANGTSQD